MTLLFSWLFETLAPGWVESGGICACNLRSRLVLKKSRIQWPNRQEVCNWITLIRLSLLQTETWPLSYLPPPPPHTTFSPYIPTTTPLPYPSPPSPTARVPSPLHSAEVGAFISIFQRELSRVKRIFLGWLKKLLTKIDKDGICRHSFSSGNIRKKIVVF